MRCVLALLLLASLLPAAKVTLVKQPAGWRLLRDGKPYFIRGAVAYQFLDRLAAAGANSIRSNPDRLDEAHRHGLTVLVNLPMGSPRHGFDYTDPGAVAGQRERIRQIVLKHKDHPALLAWCLGNELSIRTTAGERLRVWKEMDSLIRLIKQIDPNHPVSTASGDAYRRELTEIQEHVPALDFIGLNAYHDMLTLPEDVARQGWTKPYAVTEFGPVGHWQVPKTEWGVPIEQTSSEKAAFYAKAYRHAVADRPLCLGSYTFLWWQKMEKTHTWYGLLLTDGSRTEAVDAMQELWTGKLPANRAPRIGPMKITVPMGSFTAGANIRAVLDTWDPDADPIHIAWDLRPDLAGDPRVGGDFEESVAPLGWAVTDQRGAEATIALPNQTGKFRLFATVRDGKGSAATANLPILIQPAPGPFPAVKPALDSSSFGAGIQRTMHLLATSTPHHRKRVRILFYGQSITKQAWWWPVADDLRRRFPHATIDAQNLSLGGYSTQYLIRTTPQDVYAFQPDLVVFHVYGDEARYEQIIADIRSHTSAEILIQNDHPTSRTDDDPRNYDFLPRIAAKYGCGFLDLRTPWREYLKEHNLTPKDLLRDAVHLNDHGVFVMAELTRRYFQMRDNGDTNLVSAFPADGELRWQANRMKLTFEGNRIDAVAAPGLAGLRARVLIDGQPPAVWVHTRPSRAWGADWTAINRITFEKPPVEEEWRAELFDVAPDASRFRFRVIGSRTGPDGEGDNKTRFVSTSGRVVIEPEDWAIERGARLTRTAMPEGFLIHWRSIPQFAAVYESPRIDDLAQEHVVTLAQGLPNGKHTVELVAEGLTAPAIAEFRAYRPAR